MPKCACTRCGQHIEYDAAYEGQEVICPGCDNITMLKAAAAIPPATQPPPPGSPAPAKPAVPTPKPAPRPAAPQKAASPPSSSRK